MPEKIIIEVDWPDDETIEKIGGHLNDEYVYEVTKLLPAETEGRRMQKYGYIITPDDDQGQPPKS